MRIVRLAQKQFLVHNPQHKPKLHDACRTDLSYSQIADSQQRAENSCLAAVRKTFTWRVDMTEKGACILVSSGSARKRTTIDAWRKCERKKILCLKSIK